MEDPKASLVDWQSTQEGGWDEEEQGNILCCGLNH